MSRPTVAIIDSQALQHNLQEVKRLAPNSQILAMVKANAYGHDVVTIAKTLVNADAFGVACIEEAIQLRNAGISQPIVLLEGIFTPDELPDVIAHQFDIVVHNEEQIKILQTAKQKNKLRVWLKVNTGMTRLGLNSQHYQTYWQSIHDCPILKEPPILMSHFACSDEHDKSITQEQLNEFQRCTNDLSGARSLANSAAILTLPESHYDWVRPGIMLFGASPFEDRDGIELNLKPVMQLQSQLIALQHCKTGDHVGYGAKWECPENMMIGIVAIGYGDGYPREIAENTPVLVNGKRVPIVGRVSMDMLTVDLRSQPNANIGDPVTLWGDGLPIEEIAKAAGTIPYTLLCALSQRVPYVLR